MAAVASESQHAKEVSPLVLCPIVGRTAHGHVLHGLVFGALQASQQRVDELVVLALAEVCSEQVGEQAGFFQRELATHKPWLVHQLSSYGVSRLPPRGSAELQQHGACQAVS